jgi:hypothetical protein
MAEHVWRWQDIGELPSRVGDDREGWYVCITCGAHDRDEAAARATPRTCPRHWPTRLYCRCPDQAHAHPGAPPLWEATE